MDPVQMLLDRGFCEFRKGPFQDDGIKTCFQKRYDDKIGKKYFITVNLWDAWRHPYTGKVIPACLEYSVQLYSKGAHNAVNLLFLSSWTIDLVEEHMERLWDTGLYDYYEIFQ